MKRIILSIALSLFMINVYAWGVTGHRVTGLIAETYLSKKAKKEIQRILGQQSLAIASTWMDEIRSDSIYDYMEPWHWVTIQDGQTYDQSEKNSHGDIIKTIENIIAELKSHKLNAEQERAKIKILIHLIGDIHQPLHVGGGADRGGNDVKVTWFKTDSNLHRVWDSDIIDDTRLSYTEFANSLEQPDATQLKLLQKSTYIDWANESITYRPQVYTIGNGKLGYFYTYHNLPIVRKRLLQAGVRLAGVLNEIYG